MKRRTVLTALASVAAMGGVAGCTDESPEGRTTAAPDDSPTETTTSAESTTPTATTESDPYVLDEGDPLVEVTVEPGFDGEAVLDAACRDGETVLAGGEAASVDRRSDGETCSVAVRTDGETVYEETVQDYEYHRLTVTAEGELESQIVAV